MARLNYSFYLIKIISKKWGLLLTSLISLVAIYVTYKISMDKTTSDFGYLIHNNDVEAMKNMPSPLTSRPITLAVTFVSIIPFVLYSTWSILVSTNDSSQLVIISKKSTRLSMIIQRIIINIIVLFLNSLLALIVFHIISTKEIIMKPYEAASWRNSMFFGHFIASLILFSIALLLTNFFKFLTTLIIMLSIASAIPVTTISLTAGRETVTLKRLSEDSNMNILVNKESNQRSDFNWQNDLWWKSRNLHFNIDIGKMYIGAFSPKEEDVYKDYSKWDSWMAISSIFNAFVDGKSSINVKGSWTEKTDISNIIPFNEDNSIEIGNIRYIKVYEHNGVRDDGHNTLSFDWILSQKWEKYHYEQRKDALGNFVINPFTSLPYEDEIIDDTLDWPKFEANFNNLLSLLESDDDVALKYKNLSFAYQEYIMKKMLNSYKDIATNIKQRFNNFVDSIDFKEAFDSFGFSEFVQAFDKSNKERYLPSSMYPNTREWKEAQEYEILHTGSTIDKFRSVVRSNLKVNQKHYNQEYNVGIAIKIIWLIILISMFPISIFIYIRKDFK